MLLGEAEALAPRVRSAGAVFVGADSPVAAGDYATGGNHVLPTGGWARSRRRARARDVPQAGDGAAADAARASRGCGRSVEALAAVEGMPAHAEAVRR